MAAAAPLLHL